MPDFNPLCTLYLALKHKLPGSLTLEFDEYSAFAWWFPSEGFTYRIVLPLGEVPEVWTEQLCVILLSKYSFDKDKANEQHSTNN